MNTIADLNDAYASIKLPIIPTQRELKIEPIVKKIPTNRSRLYPLVTLIKWDYSKVGNEKLINIIVNKCNASSILFASTV